MSRKYLPAMMLCALGAITSLSVQAAQDIRVTYAGSMGVVMDKYLGPTFANKQHANYQGQGQGAYGMAHLLASKKVVADVFVSITPGPMDILKQAGMVDQAVPVASTSMVITYNPKSRFAPAFDAAKNNKPGAAPWWQILQSPGLTFGRTDPVSDPQGQNIVFTLLLAEKYYEQPGLAHKVLGDVQNTQQVFAEGGLLSRLEAGQVDASSGYESAAISSKLPYVKLPDQINLSNPAMAKDWYQKVSFKVRDSAGQEKTLQTQPLVFYAAVLKNAPDIALARQFVAFLQSPAGQDLLRKNGYGQPKGGSLYH